MLFLMPSISERLDMAVKAITAAVQDGLGPIALLSDSQALADQAFQFAVDFGIQMIATVLLFLAVRFFLWKPITNIIETRRQAIDKELEDAKIAKENAALDEARIKEEYKEAQAKIKEMISEAEKNANIKGEAIIASAKADAEKRLKNLETELLEEKKSMEKAIRKEVVDIAFEAAEKIVGREINQEKYLDVIDDILKGAINE
ncbi:MAG: F0F1 ATP synthase subunit B [Acholeplasmatales bacterium]|nr:F0F1 ATP synthase subunit B [Acholeplasmatales bacterium]